LETCYLPEGRLLHTPENQRSCATVEGLEQARVFGSVLEGMAVLCDERHDLMVKFGPFTGRIPREKAALGIAEGTTRDIAILSRVGKPVAFTVEAIREVRGEWRFLLSRRRAQEKALEKILTWLPGQIIPATVTHLEPFGAFVDIGCGVPSLIGVERLSVSRIAHPRDRLRVGQEIHAAVLDTDRQAGRVTLTLRELLGTWEENAALFRSGTTVPGYARGIKEYGVFVELAPNLSGLAERWEGVRESERVSVFLKAIQPDRMKLKLLIIDILPPLSEPEPLRYFITDGILKQWHYAPPGCHKMGGETVFGESPERKTVSEA